MSKQFKCLGITDETADSEIYIEEQMDAFLRIAEIASEGCDRLGRENAYFKLTDFGQMAIEGLESFEMHVWKTLENQQIVWLSLFQKGTKKIWIRSCFEG